MLRILTNIGKTIKTSSFLTRSHQLQQSMPFYAVAAGWEVGIFDTWAICEKKVKVYSKPIYKKFKTREEAEAFLKSHGVSVPSASSSSSGSYNPKEDALPLPRKAKKKKDFSTEMKKLLKQKNDSTNYRKWDSTSEESGSEDETRPQPVAPEIKESWPEDVEWEEDDEDILLAAAAEVEGIPENPLKRKIPIESSSGPSSSKILKKYSHESKIWEPIGLKKIGDFEFPIDSEGFVIVYTDGSCINNGKANAVAGFGVYFSEGHALNAAKPVVGRVTNNAGEIQAAIYAIRIAKDFGIKKLCLSTDSQFLINAVTAWMKNWKRKGWTLKGGEPVKNKEDFVILDGLLDKSIEIKWNYVKGHKGIIGNEKADQLARQGSALYKSMIGK
ncbi:uncharacterized protein LOC129950222 [Eupeodes corollae]|uniref:uncharacterized protein LOC129950222 n=1 Tax=Eupeodes corollae TaxID=290404 RepID=UPI002491DD05|nr:uncharacterized protein LOC129950222 [Eupeodes corollae]